MRDNRSGAARHGGRGHVLVALMTVGAIIVMAACNSLLDVDTPGRVQADALNDPAMAPILVSSALGQFECSFVAAVLTTGALSEEYIISNDYINSNIWGWRGTEINTADGNCTGSRTATNLGYYTPMQEARYVAEDGMARLQTFSDADVPDKAEDMAELAAYDAYTYVFLGEDFCEMALDGGKLMQPSDVLTIAEDKFTKALDLAQAAGDTDLESMSLVGRARVRLDLGDLAGAAADAKLVPQGYVRYAEYSEARPVRENRIYNMTIRNSFLSVGPTYRNLTVGGVPDPRVPVVNTGEMGQDNVTPQWTQQKYLLATSPIPIASWKEAQLILAEAVGGQDALDAVNRVRAADGIAPLGSSEYTDNTAMVLEERRRELFSQAERLNDMLRHKLPFPQGVNHKGQSYGPTTCIPLPQAETFNNPNAQ
ncbi:MAG TPA: RagB/SusD family nutrient uptake outer membrane protein [Gemmatimonadaceae bacterium]|nr:RagB/SusD family nutrient uptake outer membrane protein [Gemmatimonadaceae bacterium]